MKSFYDIAGNLFDPLHSFWERKRTKRAVALIQVAAFLVGIAGIELNRQGLLPPGLARITPLNHFYAIKLAFTLVLAQEVIDLVFVLPDSVTKAVGKQFEILALIMLRNTFKELTQFNEPITMSGIEPVLPILASGAAAILVFMGLGIYYRLHRLRPSGPPGPGLYRFVAAKKFVAVLLLAAFFGIAVNSVVTGLKTGHPASFFDVFYTFLIFSDILIVLLSHLYQPVFRSVFRNSGFAVATLLIRLALAAPPFYEALVGVAAIVFAVGLTLIYNAFADEWSKG